MSNDKAGLLANAQPWDDDIRAHALYQAAPPDGSGDTALAEAFNALTVPGPRQKVPVTDILTYLRTAGRWLGIKAAAQAGVIAAAAALDIAEDVRTDRIDLDLPIIQHLLPGLVTASLITQDQLAAIDAMGDTAIPWWQSIGATSPFNEHDIARARAGG